jgi:hypothetical protein
VNGDTMSEAFDEGLEAFAIRAKHAWELLQARVWGAHWDWSEPSLDYSRASLLRLSDWLLLAARGQAVTELKDLLGPASQYFGETVLEHARGDWERRDDETIGLYVECSDGEVRHIGMIEVFSAWVAAARGGKGKEREVLIEHFDRAVAGALPPILVP